MLFTTFKATLEPILLGINQTVFERMNTVL
jgi:superfamily II DNA or RNA helicase